MEESRGCFAPAVAILVISILLVLGRAWSEETVSLDFVDSRIQEVARSVSLAYGVPVLVDGDVDARVTFHLEGVGLLEGLSSLCSTLGLEVFRDGSVLRIRHAVPRGENYFSVSDSLVTLSVEGRDIHDFVRDFSMNTGLNVVVAPEVSGKVSGTLRSVRAEDALRVLLGAHGFRVVRESGCFRVVPRRQESKGASDGSVPEIEESGGLYSVILDGASVADFLRELSRVAALNLVMYGDIQERAPLRDSDDLLGHEQDVASLRVSLGVLADDVVQLVPRHDDARTNRNPKVRLIVDRDFEGLALVRLAAHSR